MHCVLHLSPVMSFCPHLIDHFYHYLFSSHHIAREVHSFTKEKLVENEIEDESKSKKPLEEDVDSGGKKKAEKGKTQPEEAEEKSFWDDVQEEPVKKTKVDDVEAPAPVKAQKSVTEPETAEEKSFWDDVDDDGRAKKATVDDVDAPKQSKGRKSVSEPEVAEEKSIWDENHNEQNKKPKIEEVETETQTGKKTRTQAEVIEEVPIDEDIKTPKRKSVKKQSVTEEPLSAETEGINSFTASCFSSVEQLIVCENLTFSRTLLHA